jgi:predicted alpha-1,6-mannanase (GH76 family)
MQEKIDNLIEVVKAATKRKSCKRQYIRAEETLTIGKVTNLIATTVDNYYDDSDRLSKRVRAGRRCGRCSKVRHNSRTCKVEIEDADDSDASD